MEVTYSQASSLRLSNDALVDRLLSDVPFFSVGVMAFAVFTLFLITKRSNLLATYLYSSALLAFVASTLDLSHALLLTDANPLQGLIIGREVVLSLSIGFRMIFIWGFGFSHDPPHKRHSSEQMDRESLSSFRIDNNTTSWEKGVFGTVIKWFLLLIITAVPVLQIIWRLASSMNYHGPLYVTESSLEIAILSIFVLKLLLNTYLATPWTITLLSYTAPLLAIALGLSTAIGNLLIFCFSETTLGRFLQAIELYVLILWVMIIAFGPPPRRSPQNRPRSSFQSWPEKGPYPPDNHFNISHPMAVPGAAISFLQPPLADTGIDPAHSKASIPGVPLDPGAGERQSSGGDRHPFGTARDTIYVDQRQSSPVSLAFVLGNDGGQGGFNSASPVPQLEGRSNPISAAAASKRFRHTSLGSNMAQERIVSEENLLTGPPFSYDEAIPPPPPPPLNILDYRGAGGRESESPVYSLHGIIRSSRVSTVPSDSRRSSSRFSALVREHREMDRTISKLLSMRGSLQSVHSPQKASTISCQSEISLSNFPSPPDMSLFPSDLRGGMSNRRFMHPQAYQGLPERDVPTSAIYSSWRDDSLDTSITNSRLGSQVGSQGTQYDVTSFIGAEVSTARSSTPIRTQDLSDIESGDDSSSKEMNPTVRDTSQRPPIATNTLPSTPKPQAGRAPPHSPFKPLYINRTVAIGSPRPGVPRLSALNKSRTPTRVQVIPTAHRPRSLVLTTGLEPPGSRMAE